MERNDRPKLALILGSGFSNEAGLPTTSDLSKSFLEPSNNGVLPDELENGISRILRDFWREVFGYTQGPTIPSLEDPFTLLDLAANSGHHLGSEYSPRKLRAIRRMSIHRVFQILDKKYKQSNAIRKLLDELIKSFDLSIICLNWDIVVEKYLRGLEKVFTYGIEIEKFNSSIPFNHEGIPVLKVHGSSNWVYCDSCRRLYGGIDEKSALHRKAFLEKGDFEIFDVNPAVLNSGLESNNDRKCPHCGNMMGGRVATFSYRKAFSINQFQTIWDRAYQVLNKADTWLFVGYSMPQADFEFRHLLKSAQLSRKNPNRWKCEVILKNHNEAVDHYRNFFGLPTEKVYQVGLSDWADNHLERFCQPISTGQ